MRSNIFSVLAAVLMLLGCGCAKRYADVMGEKYEMISEREERQLAEKARIFMKSISKRLTPADVRIIENNAPEMRFIYSGDRYGRAIVYWSLSRYEAGVEFEGSLMSRKMAANVFTKEKGSKVLDFRRPDPRHRSRPDLRRRGNKVK